MEVLQDETPPVGTATPGPEIWKDVKCLVILLILAAGLRAWLILHTEVMARDGVGFIRYACQLTSQPWPEVLRQNPHPPLYPLSILAVSYPVRLFCRADNTVAMQLSAQLASSLAGVLLVFPMFYLGKELFDRGVAFWATALFQCLPIASRILADALSEGLFLLVAALALVVAVRSVKTYSWQGFGLCGVLAGLAYLVRPEGLLVVGGAALVLVAMQAMRTRRRPWRQFLAAFASLVVAAAVFGAPYVAVIHRLTNKPSGLEVLQSASAVYPEPEAGGYSPAPAPFAVFWFDIKERPSHRRLLWGIQAVVTELLRGFNYAAAPVVVVGLLWFRKRLVSDLGTWMVVGLCAMYAALLWRVAYVAGYVADRHMLVIVMCGAFWAAAGANAAGLWLLALIQRRRLGQSEFGTKRIFATLSAVPLGPLLIAILALTALPKSFEPLHRNRAGYHAAGLWLAAHAAAEDAVWDPFAWAEYYSGRTFVPEAVLAAAREHASRHYVVLGCSENEHVRLPMIPIAESLAARGTIVYRWTDRPGKHKAEEVVVYLVDSAPKAASASMAPKSAVPRIKKTFGSQAG